jgi:hypothetical protein
LLKRIEGEGSRDEVGERLRQGLQGACDVC